MPPRAAPLRYEPVAMVFHWSIAALIVIDFCFGVSFGKFDPGDALYWPAAYPLHMSIGMTVMVLSVACVLWRAMHRYPSLPADMHLMSRLAAKAAHVLLYVFIIMAPLSGWGVLSLRRSPPVLLDGLHWPTLGFLAGLPANQRTLLHDRLLPAHVILSYLGMCLVSLHVAAALYHHFWRRDEILRRMLPGGTSDRTILAGGVPAGAMPAGAMPAGGVSARGVSAGGHDGSVEDPAATVGRR